MAMRLIASALFAGASAGLIAALLQLFAVQPVLLHAELFESGELVQNGSAPVPWIAGFAGFDPVRDGLSVLFSMLIYTAYGFVLMALMAFAEDRGATVNARAGLAWGMAGFIAAHFAPAISLPPEVPGVAAADVAPRQIWWFACVATTALGLWLIAFGRAGWMYLAAIVLIAAPHIVGAPEPEEMTGPAPTEIGALFATRALGVGMVAWIFLGLFAGYFWQREGQREG